MKSKLEQYNQAFKKALGTIVYKVIPDIESFTVTDFLLDPSFMNARVWVRTTNDDLKHLEEKRADIQGHLKDYVKTRYTPKLTFILDDSYLDHIDTLFSEVEKENPATDDLKTPPKIG